MNESVQAATLGFVALLASALAISIAAQRIRIPGAVLLVALGSAASYVLKIAPPFAFGPALIFVFLPPLIFEAAWCLDLRLLRVLWRQIAFLALPGTLLSAFGVALGLAWMHLLPFAPALVLGATIAATDPVAVVAIFRAARVPARLSTIVEAESLANDGVAVVLYGSALMLATGGAFSWGTEALHGAAAVAAGCIVGALCALPFWAATAVTDGAEYDIAATIALAYLSYLVAFAFHASGIFASATAAIVLRALVSRYTARFAREAVSQFWFAAAYMANAVVFLATGLLIQPARLLNEPLLIFGTIALVVLVRVLLAALAVRALPARIVIFMAGIRGALPLALALALPASVPGRANIIDAIYATVLFTLIAQAVPLRALTQRLFRPATISS